MTRLGRDRIAVLAGAILFLAGNAAFFFLYGSTERDRRAGLEQRRARLSRQVEESAAEAARLAEQRNRLLGVSEAVQEFYGKRVGPREVTLAPVVEEIHRLLKKSGASPSQISYEVEPLEGLPLSRMVVSFSFQGDYVSFKRFLRDVAASSRWLAVQEAAVARDPGGLPGAVEVRVRLATYFSGETPLPRRLPRSAARARS